MCASCISVFFFKQKTAYEMRISDWSSDVCSSDLLLIFPGGVESSRLPPLLRGRHYCAAASSIGTLCARSHSRTASRSRRAEAWSMASRVLNRSRWKVPPWLFKEHGLAPASSSWSTQSDRKRVVEGKRVEVGVELGG